MNQFIDYRPPRIAMSFVLIAVAVHFMLLLPLHPSLPVAAWVLGCAGFALMTRAWWLFELVDTAICPTETSTTLVTQDVFSVSRNPMYLGISLMLGALATAIGTVPFYIASLGFFAVIDRKFCPYEEQKAAAEFGRDYEVYARSVRRWL